MLGSAYDFGLAIDNRFPEDSLRCVLFELFDSFPDTVLCCGGAECMPSKSENIFSCSKVLIDAGVVGRSGSSNAVAVLSSASGGLASRSAIDFVKVEDGSSISAMAADGEKAGELGDIEDCIFTNESSGLPSSSGSGRNFEEKERPRPLPVVSEPPGDIIYPAGEKPPDRAAELTSTIEEALESCLDTACMPWEDSNEDLWLSERFCSSCNSFIASSIEEVMLRRSAVFSRCSMLLV